MKFLIVLAIISLPIAVSGATNELQYDLEVSGMKCAFCAYNVSKQIESLDGVVPQSVDVDLEQGAVRLRSEKALDETICFCRPDSCFRQQAVRLCPRHNPRTQPTKQCF